MNVHIIRMTFHLYGILNILEESDVKLLDPFNAPFNFTVP
jgi:hypothetical protein